MCTNGNVKCSYLLNFPNLKGKHFTDAKDIGTCYNFCDQFPAKYNIVWSKQYVSLNTLDILVDFMEL